jgi:predicted nucleotidyltransferase
MKDGRILELFFNEPTKQWHFEEILKRAEISRPQAAQWLSKFIKDKLIRRIKIKSKMPYYISDYNSVNYQNKKRLFMLNQFYSSGFLNHLQSSKAKTVIIFGSMNRWDWYKDSDIDLFVYGDDNGLEIGKYELKLKRDIQLFSAKNKEDLKKLSPDLIQNIFNGFIVKGSIKQAGVKIRA